MIVLQIAQPPAVAGTVRAADTGAPVADARVEVLASPAAGRAPPDAAALGVAARTDAEGRYVVRVGQAGSYTLHFVRAGFRSLTADAELPAGGALRMNVALTPVPVRLPAVRVVSRRGAEGNADGSPAAVAGGTWVVDSSAAQVGLLTGSGDPFAALAAAPHAGVLPESPVAARLRGGSGDQGLMLVDGVPVWNAWHARGGPAALNPDVVATVTLRGGALPARFGGRLAGLVDVRTRDDRAGPATFATRGAFADGATRLAVTVPLSRAGARLLVAGRRGVPALAGVQDGTGARAVWGDVFVKASAPLGGGTLDALLLGGRDGLALDAATETPATAPATAAAEVVTRDGAAGADESADDGEAAAADGIVHAFGWRTGTGALVWHGGPAGGPRWTGRVWHSTADARAAWAAGSRPLALRSTVRHTGAAADAAWAAGQGAARAGLAIERLATGYAVGQGVAPAAGSALAHSGRSGAGSPLAGAPLALTAAPLLLSAYAERRWQPAPQWEVDAGARLSGVGLGQIGWEPRVLARYTPWPRLSLSAGAARTRQFVQSLRNEESVLDALVGVDFPVAVGAPGVPVARSDEVTAAAAARLAPGLTLTVDAYARRMRGLMLPALVTGQPFAVDQLATGTGAADGAAVTLRGGAGRLGWRAGYAYGRTKREGDRTRYRPAFGRAHTAVVSAAYRPGWGTRLRGALWFAAGRPTTLVGDVVAWDAATRELSGTPQRTVGPLGAAQLPQYARLDLGVSRDWRLGTSRGARTLTTWVELRNALGRQNAFATVLPPGGGAPSALLMQPRTLTAGLAWRF